MLTDADLDWLKATNPGLRPTPTGGVSGTARIDATYDAEKNQFQILYREDSVVVGGIRLEGEFGISIENRLKDSPSVLPALCIDGFGSNSDRHISPDGTACLCSPLIEGEFLEPFAFRTFFEQLIVPFLYGQLYYELHHQWPWSDYSHANLGILESYQPAISRADVTLCLAVLKRDSGSWYRVRAALTQHGTISDSVPCICRLRHRMARCHPRALRGLQQLRSDIREFGVRL